MNFPLVISLVFALGISSSSYYSHCEAFSPNPLGGTKGSITACRGGGGGSPNRFSQQKQAVVSDAETTAASAGASEEVDQDDDSSSSSMFKFYLLKGGMCPYAARTWITLLELGLPFDMVEVSAMKKEDWFLEINPRGKVPALQNLQDGTVLYESAICDEYLCDVAREMELDDKDSPSTTEEQSSSSSSGIWKLMPLKASEKAYMRLLNDHMDTQLGPAQYTFLMNTDAEKDPELIEALEKALDPLQESLTERGGPYLMGSEFTLAEAHILPFFLRLVVSLKHFKNYEIPPKKYGKLLDWYEMCSQRESVKATGKSNEKIIEVYQKFVDMKYGFGGLNKNK